MMTQNTNITFALKFQRCQDKQEDRFYWFTQRFDLTPKKLWNIMRHRLKKESTFKILFRKVTTKMFSKHKFAEFPIENVRWRKFRLLSKNIFNNIKALSGFVRSWLEYFAAKESGNKYTDFIQIFSQGEPIKGNWSVMLSGVAIYWRFLIWKSN